LKKNDVIVAVDGKATPDRETLGAMIGRHKPGDSVAIRFRRSGQEEDVKVTLDKFPFADRGDFQNNMGTDISERRKGFPITLQHDTDLKSYQCGGPLVDLEGRVIGINIARGGRTDTYAIPAEVIKPLLPELLTKASESSVIPNGLIEKIRSAQTAVKEAEAQKLAAEKKLADAKAALEKLLAEQKREKEKK
jgi:serine protease Do